MGDVTIQKLKALTGQFDHDMIFKVPLAKIGVYPHNYHYLFFLSVLLISTSLASPNHFSGLSSLPECLKMCSNLTVLDVSFNNLTSVEALAPLKYLKTLIIVSNKIEKLGMCLSLIIKIKKKRKGE